MKGISPLIASVLLIAFVMAIGGIIVTFGTTFSRQQLDTSATEGECLNSLYAGNAEYVDDTINFKLRNVGNADLFGIKALVEYDNDPSLNIEVELKNHGIDEPLKPSETQFASVGMDLTDPSIVSYWSLDETVEDLSLNDNDGILFGGTDCSSSIDGKKRTACSFDGNDDYIDFGNDETFNTDSVSVTFWIKRGEFLGAGGNAKYIMTKKDAVDESWTISSNRLTDLVYFNIQTDGGVTSVASDQELEEDVWYHIAATYDTIDVKLYINGEEEKQKAHLHPGPIHVTPLSVIAGARTPGVGNLNAVLDEIYVWDKAISEREIKNIMVGGITPKPDSIELFSTKCARQAIKIHVT